jgi:hypothetical protein
MHSSERSLFLAIVFWRTWLVGSGACYAGQLPLARDKTITLKNKVPRCFFVYHNCGLWYARWQQLVHKCKNCCWLAYCLRRGSCGTLQYNYNLRECLSSKLPQFGLLIAWGRGSCGILQYNYNLCRRVVKCVVVVIAKQHCMLSHGRITHN